MAKVKGGASSVAVPNSFGLRQAAKDAALVKLAQAAAAEVERAGAKVERVMEALATFWDAVWEMDVPAAHVAVERFAWALVEGGRADLDPEDAWDEVRLGLHGMECVNQDALADTVAELEDISTDEAAMQIDAMVGEVLEGLAREDVARVAGLGIFRLEEGQGPSGLPVVRFDVDNELDTRAAAVMAGREETEEWPPFPYRAVLEGFIDAFMNEWAVDIDGFGTFACHAEDAEDEVQVVFKASLEVREELGSSEDDDET